MSATGKSPVFTYVAALEADCDQVLAGLLEHDGATVKRAIAVIERAQAEIDANLRLLREHEGPRQQAVAKAREERAQREHQAAELEAAAKAKRVETRRALRAALKGRTK
jgi:hypothetical protein